MAIRSRSAVEQRSSLIVVASSLALSLIGAASLLATGIIGGLAWLVVAGLGLLVADGSAFVLVVVRVRRLAASGQVDHEAN
jgi:hypothetical protein